MLLLIPFLLLAENNNSEVAIPVMNFDQLQPLLQKENDSIYVINFWATWCGPCVKEIPYFEQLGKNYQDKKLKILMISLDMPNQLDSRVIPYIKKQGMQNPVILLDDPKFNDWIPLVDKQWTGALPATLIYGNGFREFYPGELTYEELESIVKPLLEN